MSNRFRVGGATIAAALVLLPLQASTHSTGRHPEFRMKPHAVLNHGQAPHLFDGALDLEVSRNVIVNDPQLPFPFGLIGRSELAITALTSRKLLTGWNDAQGFCGPPFDVPCTAPVPPGLNGFGFSRDAGRKWTDGGAPPPFPLGANIVITRSDPSLASSTQGTRAYFATIGIGSPDLDINGVLIHRAVLDDDDDDDDEHHTSSSGANDHDDDDDDSRPAFFAWNPALTRFLRAPAGADYDKEMIAVDPDNGKRAYVTYTNFFDPNAFGQIELFRTRDGGDTWLGPVIVRREIATSPESGTVLQGSEPSVGPRRTHDGHDDDKEDEEHDRRPRPVYVAFEQGPVFVDNEGVLSYQIRVARSDDNGATFGPSRLVKTINGTFLRTAPAGYNRPSINDFPRIAVIQEGRFKGRVLVTYNQTKTPTGTDEDVLLSYSDDNGVTWHTVNVATATGVQEFFPDVDVNKDGVVVVEYYRGLPGTSIDPVTHEAVATTFVDTFLAVSSNGGTSFRSMPAVRVSSLTSDWATTFTNIIPNFGDYNTVDLLGNDAFCSWAGSDETVLIEGLLRRVPAAIFGKVEIDRRRHDTNDDGDDRKGSERR